MSLRRYSNLAIILFLSIFVIYSILGAFLGAERAQAFFNSIPLVVFWLLLLVFLIVGFVVYVSLRKRSSLMLIHLGCILVLAGGIYGSSQSHILLGRLLQKQLFTKGTMPLHEGQSSDQVATKMNGETCQLPFSIQLKEAFIEYYDQPVIYFYLSRDKYYPVPVKVGEIFELPDDQGTIHIHAAYKNFKMNRQGDRMIPYDSTEPGYNPAYELAYTPKDGEAEPFFVFERHGMHALPGRSYHAELIPPRMVKDYKSTLQVVDNGEFVKEVTIEVNKPLYYGGYHFYQNTFAYDQSGPISGILVTSARGAWVVFVGYAMIFTGLVVQFWPRILKGPSR